MIVRILSSAASFAGVTYNTDKIEKDKGELLRIANFGPLQGLQRLRPEDYKNYLRMLSAQNKRVSLPQFHAVISAPGKAYCKQDLTLVAEKWLAEMGYGKQPYMVVFHKDTANNHVHLVSTRIDRQGKKINSAFENIRALKALNHVMGTDEKYSAAADLEKALAYRFSTIAQFKMLLENQGYTLKDKDNRIEVIKFGVRQLDLPRSRVLACLKKEVLLPGRRPQLRAIFNKYALQYDTILKRDNIALPSGINKPALTWSCALAQYLKEKQGIVLLFHASADKPPYGYSIIDHSAKAVYKGSGVMSFRDLLGAQKIREPGIGRGLSEESQAANNFHNIDRQTGITYLPVPALYLSPDIDDEAVLGRNRRRKHKTRTNTR